ncbi:MAG TPA: prepilin-type N-terminal cleavage/methylation domain-containing protein [Pirellulales bacterium]|nr:prepilin-type N-terminal cleavage/methylation domain-containing protein [Pirellulales bacterium]
MQARRKAVLRSYRARQAADRGRARRARRGSASRRGFTLVEVLIAATISLVLVGLVVQVLATIGTTASDTRSVVQMTDRLRSTRIVITQDLANITPDMTKIPIKSELLQGYFEYIEGPDGPIFPGLNGTLGVAYDINQATAAGTPPQDSTVGDPDDVLMFTTNSPKGTYFYGRMRSSTSVVDSSGSIWTMPVDTMAQSSTAEICYFMRGSTLYRRVLLVMPASDWPNNQIDPTIFLWSQYPNYINGGTASIPQPIWDISFYDKFDLSAHQKGGTFDISNSTGGTQPPVLLPNTLGDLTLRQNRYGHQPWVYPYDARFWDERFWTNSATDIAGGFLGLPTLRECSAYTGTGGSEGTPPLTTGTSGVARWPFPLFESNVLNPIPLTPFSLSNISGGPARSVPFASGANATVASGYLWGQFNSFAASGLGTPTWVQPPIYPYSTLPLIWPFPTTPPPGTSAANFQPATTVPSGVWTGRINLTNTQGANGSLFDLWSNPYPLDQQDPVTGAIYAFSSAFQPANTFNVNFNTRYADDVLMTHVLSFDVKAWDSTAPTLQTTTTFGGIPPGTYLPGDPGYVQIINSWATTGTNPITTLQQNLQPAQLSPGQPTGAYGGYGFVVAQGAYVDLNYLGPVIQPFINAGNFQMAQALSGVSTFAGPGVSQFGMASNPGSGLAMVYDTGCFDYENDGIDQNQNGIIDDYTNGIDDNGIGGVDDQTEVEGPIPYPIPLKGIQIKIRAYEPDSREIREVTITQDFLAD